MIHTWIFILWLLSTKKIRETHCTSFSSVLSYKCIHFFQGEYELLPTGSSAVPGSGNGGARRRNIRSRSCTTSPRSFGPDLAPDSIRGTESSSRGIYLTSSIFPKVQVYWFAGYAYFTYYVHDSVACTVQHLYLFKTCQIMSNCVKIKWGIIYMHES